MAKFEQYIKAFTICCTKHTEFCAVCSPCWLTLQAYSRTHNIDTEIRNILNYATQLNSVPWKPFMSVGYWKHHTNTHSMGWSRELYTERKTLYNKYHKINQPAKDTA